MSINPIPMFIAVALGLIGYGLGGPIWAGVTMLIYIFICIIFGD